MSVRKCTDMNIKVISFVLFIFVFAATMMVAVRLFMNAKNNAFISPLADGFVKKTEAKNSVQSKKNLSALIEPLLTKSDENFSIVVKNLKTNEVYTRDENHTYSSASLYKLWIMAETYRQIEKRELSLDEVLSQDIATLNRKFDIASESAELTEGGISMSVKNALNQMITISHNYAALLLSEKIKLANVKNFLESNGFTQSSTGSPPVTSAKDVALFFEKLYTGKLGNSENTKAMIELLKTQQVNHKLPKSLPENTIIAHKTGELDTVSHDGGIVYGKKGDYIIVVMSESDTRKEAEERIAAISKAVYDYFE